MKVTAISDTHGKHTDIELSGGDVLIHAGDVSRRGSEKEIMNFLDWFDRQQYGLKVFIAGNHDFFFEKKTNAEIQQLLPENVIYLNDSGCEAKGLKIWGSPVTPWYYNWAFNRQTGAEIRRHWDMIPTDTDILITHGPPRNILDKTLQNQHVGCEDLLHRLNQIHPAYHIFGHIHESFGIIENSGVHFINASVLDENYIYRNPPVDFIYASRGTTLAV
jgi:Icc-related predicted phosphoesterase